MVDTARKTGRPKGDVSGDFEAGKRITLTQMGVSGLRLDWDEIIGSGEWKLWTWQS